MEQTNLTTNEVARLWNINPSTLRTWRRCRLTDKRYPRFHKLCTGKVFYVKAEFEADFRRMEVSVERLEVEV